MATRNTVRSGAFPRFVHSGDRSCRDTRSDTLASGAVLLAVQDLLQAVDLLLCLTVVKFQPSLHVRIVLNPGNLRLHDR